MQTSKSGLVVPSRAYSGKLAEWLLCFEVQAKCQMSCSDEGQRTCRGNFMPSEVPWNQGATSELAVCRIELRQAYRREKEGFPG